MDGAASFEKAYKTLNSAQKQAVDTVEGPVLVIAGPGTGKTHILTLRIANILKKTQDTSPENILVLTFTDSAARTVARRLGELIGPEVARKVGVFTFHSFAEHIMKKHPEAFPDYADGRLMGEVEQVLLWREVLSRGTESLIRPPKSPFHYLNDLKALEDDLLRERKSVEDYRAWLNEEAKRIEEDPELRYKRGGKGGAAGELNPTGTRKLERLFKGKEAADVIQAFREEKAARNVYGYTDVLRIAVDTLAEDAALRADLLEQYQYVLADEHQDANALQHALLDALAFDDFPNLFVVGDEKQAVYGFQGADTTHFKTFLTLYPRTKVITLVENFRSQQTVLDVSHTLLGGLPSATGTHAELLASRGVGGSVQLLTAPDPLAERDQVTTLVERALSEGVPPHEIAVITLKNKTADLFALHLRACGIATLRAGDIDLDSRPSVRFLFALMHAVADPADVASLRDALLAPWWKESLAERSQFLRRTRDYELPDELRTSLPQIARVFDTLIRVASEAPPLTALSQILSETGARAYFLGSVEGIAEDVPLVRAVILHIEDLVRRTPNATFREVMENFAHAREHEIGSIKTSLTQREGFVTVITAHKAKGMEFQRVFVTALTSREWEGRGKSSLIPSPFDEVREKEEVIRLLYVAMTRAKDELVLTYAAAGNEGKEQAPISILPSGLPLLSVEENLLPEMHEKRNAPELIRELTLRYLTEDGLSPSALNDYLESPARFFARRVLRISTPETRALAVGNAVHAAAAGYLKLEGTTEERATAAHAELSRSLSRSLLPRGDTFVALTRHAHTLADTVIADPIMNQKTVAVEESFSTKRTVGAHEILLKGKVDAVFESDAGERIIDFKTSRSIDASDKEKFGRQIAFYDFLLRANEHQTVSGEIIRIGEDEIDTHEVLLTDAMRAEFIAQLDEALSELISGVWRAGESDPEYDAVLNLFTETP